MILKDRIDSWEVDPQAKCSLFTTLPSEIRMRIFSLALLAEYEWVYTLGKPQNPPLPQNPLEYPNLILCPFDQATDEDVASELAAAPEIPEHVEVFQGVTPGRLAGPCLHTLFPPGLGGEWSKPYLTTTLLATCRRVYTEAHMLIYGAERWYSDWLYMETNTHRFTLIGDVEPPTFESYGFDVPSPQEHWSKERFAWETNFSSIRFVGSLSCWAEFLLQDPELELRRFAHMHNQLGTVRHLRYSPSSSKTWGSRLWSGSDRNVCWRWEPLVLSDSYSGCVLKSIYKTARAVPEKRHSSTDLPGRPSWMPRTPNPQCIFSDTCWAREFVNMPRIESFTMDFSLPEDVREVFDNIMLPHIIDTWVMPLNPAHAGYHYMSARGNPVRKFSWRGAFDHWNDFCLECNRNMGFDAPVDWCKSHKAIREKFVKGAGPRMYSWTVTWTPRKHEEAGEFVYPYNGAIQVKDDDL
ncbi:uncharacterized protein PpBr36_09309 [Pyricularia pennisetigena]|uniref:uncharacterized protein n=1 Tax=Pyricularia pennisetigena TaxID=1578925 RepID=UPI001153DB88|nr:uncharacterized protein PpBr36_09309 [Pyricularia pennisetigena]TLS21789.1 hypothetical protein PpBr36_09309 [Pyricularia pennisetigena]